MKVQRWGVVLGGCLVWSGAVGPAQVPEPGPVRVGMTSVQVVQALGGKEPRRVARQILYHRTVEQWTYEEPRLRITLDQNKGQPARVTEVREAP